MLVFIATFAVIGITTLMVIFAEDVATVTLQGSKLYVNGQRFNIRGVNYNPVYIGSDQYDYSAAANDVPKIKALGANTIGTYFLGKAEYQQYSDLTQGEQQYLALMPAAEQAGLKVIVGYYSNETIDWTNSARVTKVTTQYQELVNKAKLSPATLMYMVGNEIFEKLPNDTQRVSYAKWLGDMANWTHANDPKHPVFYSDRGDLFALPWLKAYAPNLDIQGVNNYSFTSTDTLKSIVQRYQDAWPGKPVMVHEWGADSYNVNTGQEDLNVQADNISRLASAVDTVTTDPATTLVGGLNFELTDEWRFVGSLSTQDKDAGFLCESCFDGKANEDYWGLMRATANGESGQRNAKPAFAALQSLWGGSPPTVSPPPTSDITAPVITINQPLNNATVVGKVIIGATATDNIAVANVSWYLDGIKKNTDTNVPYEFLWDTRKVKTGQHTITMVVTDTSNNSTSRSVIVVK